MSNIDVRFVVKKHRTENGKGLSAPTKLIKPANVIAVLGRVLGSLEEN